MVRVTRIQELPRESFLTTGPPPVRAWRNPDRETITRDVRLVVTHQDGHQYDWRGLTNPYSWHPATNTQWPANGPVPKNVLDHEAPTWWLVVDVVPEAEWYEWKAHGDNQDPHPLQTVYRVPTHVIWYEA